MAAQSRRARQQRAQRRRERLVDLHARVAAQERQLTTPQGWREWLEVAARFPRGEHSLNNLLLIWQQRPESTALAGYDAWQAQGRQVRRGEHGVRLIADDDRRGEQPVNLFDVAQTEPAEGVDGAAAVSLAPPTLGVSAESAREHVRQVLAQVTGAGDGAVREVEVQAAAFLVLRAHGHAVEAPSTAPTSTAARGCAERALTVARAVLGRSVDGGDVERSRALLERVQRGARQTAGLAERAQLRAARGAPGPGRVGRDLATVGEQDLFATPARLQRLAEVNAAAAAFYREQLAGAPQVRAQLRQRVGDGSALPGGFVLGYAPPDWTPLLDHLRAQGFADRDLLDAGVVQESRNGRLLDRFRDRVLVGLHDEHGRLAGFIGRAVPLDAAPGEHIPKYLNTSATELFDKGRALIGLHEQRGALEAGAVPVLVEGPFDVLATAAAPGAHGRVVPIATSGTAVSAEQVAAILQAASSPRFVLAHDADDGGRAATVRTAEMLLTTTDREVRAARLPDGHDPASWARAQPERVLLPYLDDRFSRPAVQVVIDARIASFGERLQWVDGRVDAMRHAVRVLDGQPREVAAAEALRIAQRLQLDPVTVAEELGEVPKSGRAAQRAIQQRLDALTGRARPGQGSAGRPHPARLASMAFPDRVPAPRPHAERPSTRAPGPGAGRDGQDRGR
ncbi:hypothetical protein DI005_20140 [Prauserella sp. PE36]|uniref:toprim domain-containing protein n=1 Tax=Prauserella sp. PE36 TaxID=1504709 RepID=UPI000DE1F817|nr:toprim domain-containing protein [Prauserella sp. PE36]RBM18105.1 hypothetical protein DI005_20140 [Prauserella sp. PE36]